MIVLAHGGVESPLFEGWQKRCTFEAMTGPPRQKLIGVVLDLG